MLAAQIIVVSREFLHLDTLELAVIPRNLRLALDQLDNQINSIPMLNPHEWTIQTLPQQRPRRLHIRRRHATLQKLEIFLTPIHRIPNHKFHEPFTLRNQLIQRNKRSLVLHMRKLRQMLGRVALLRTETLLASVHLSKPTNGRLQRQLTAHSQPHLHRIPPRIIPKHVRLHHERLPRTLAITHRHDIRIGQLNILLIHEQMHPHVQLGSNAKHALGSLGAEPIKGKVAQRNHFLFGSLLQRVGYWIEYGSDDADGRGYEFKVLDGGGGGEDDFTIDYYCASDGNVFGLGELFEC
mmetsp:Transcript_11453/g.25140  ORF Transcript_11453/g.25140 Transcript_11453/m.25140 type:complete len:295 (-) Transcript_11453:440-1324(-)